MNVSHLSAHVRTGRPERRDSGQHPGDDAFSSLAVGQQVELGVVRRLDNGSFLVVLAGGEHIMDSSVQLAVGGRIRAVVVAVGNRLELRYLDSGESPSPREDDQSAADGSAADATASLIANLEARYRVTLQSADQALVERAVSAAADPTAMALGGFYLAKVGAPISGSALDALHDAQLGPTAGAAAGAVAHDVSSMLEGAAKGDSASVADLATVLSGALPESPSGSLPSSSFMSSDSSDSESREDLARELLNLQDGGSIAYRYGTLPVIVAGQLVELELVALQQRALAQQSSPVRRLAMTLQTRSFGQVRIEARALEDRLMVTFTGQSPQGTQELESYRAEVRSLLGRLGWNVEALGYEVVAHPSTAARNVIDHVLSAGTVNLVV